MSVDLLKDPIPYAKKAVEVLEHQLKTAKSAYRKIRLKSKIKEWEKFIELMETPDEDSKIIVETNEE